MHYLIFDKVFGIFGQLSRYRCVLEWTSSKIPLDQTGG